MQAVGVFRIRPKQSQQNHGRTRSIHLPPPPPPPHLLAGVPVIRLPSNHHHRARQLRGRARHLVGLRGLEVRPQQRQQALAHRRVRERGVDAVARLERAPEVGFWQKVEDGGVDVVGGSAEVWGSVCVCVCVCVCVRTRGGCG